MPYVYALQYLALLKRTICIGTLPKNSKHRRELRLEVSEEDEVKEQTQN
jgi:hypothetical protein